MRARAPNVSHCVPPPLPPGAAAAQPAAAASACMRTEAVRPATPAREPAPARKSPSHALTERRVWFLQQRQRSSSPTMPVPRKNLPCTNVVRDRVRSEASAARSEQATLRTSVAFGPSNRVLRCVSQCAVCRRDEHMPCTSVCDATRDEARERRRSRPARQQHLSRVRKFSLSSGAAERRAVRPCDEHKS